MKKKQKRLSKLEALCLGFEAKPNDGEGRPAKYSLNEEQINEYNRIKSVSKPVIKPKTAKKVVLKTEKPLWVEKQRARHREKYQRLNYVEKQKDWNKDKPWTKTGKYKNLHRKFGVNKGSEIHHWSYKDENLEDFFVLTTKVHKNCHRFLTFNFETLHFIGVNGEVLDTKEKHKNYIQVYIQ
jgi:hypothetical protein